MISPENPYELHSEWLIVEGWGIPGGEAARLSITRQCELLGITRTSMYRKKAEPDMEREDRIKGRIDYWHTKMSYLGVRRLRDKLREDDRADEAAAKENGEDYEPMGAGRKLIARYMTEMGIRTVYPKPSLSGRGKEHKVYPYLLRDKSFIRFPNQVWAIDITYIKMIHGHMYLTAIIDWRSRYIVGWALSDTLGAAPVVECVKAALERQGVPAIINSDQGSQFTSEEYTTLLREQRIRQSMDGKDRWVDNVIIERWFRSFKTEWLYVTELDSPRELRAGIAQYVDDYNSERPHQSLGYERPVGVYGGAFWEAA
jgi:putative transposase